MDGTDSKLLSPRDLAKVYGITSAAVLDWYHDGIIPAEIAEGRIYRFDPEKVRLVLRHRAAQRAEDELRRRRPEAYFNHSSSSPPPPPSPVQTAIGQRLDGLPKEEPYAFMAMIKAREARKRRDAKEVGKENK